MAKEIDKIIQSKTAPKSNNVLWDDGENLKINRNGKWSSIGSNDFSTQVFSTPFEILQLSEQIEIGGIMTEAIPIDALEEYYKTDWDLMFNKMSKFNFITLGPHIPFYIIKSPNKSGTGYDSIQMYILSPDNLTQSLVVTIFNKTRAQNAGFGNYVIVVQLQTV